MLYDLIRPLLFQLPPEAAHHLSLAALSLSPVHRPPLPWSKGPVEVMGLRFENPLGLAAGLDKNGDYIDALGAFGFGFIEVGTVTPRPQPGNPKPRLFRVPEAQAVINRMGFNNKGVEHLVGKVKKRRYSGVLGINIGKNFDTPVERALDDYTVALEQVHPWADYITINISSPNTPGLRSLQQADALESLVSPLRQRLQELNEHSDRKVPLVVKVAPDLDDSEVDLMADVFNRIEIDGVIATNTTLSRVGVEGLPHGLEQGGLSGRPVFEISNRVLAAFRKKLDTRIALIGAGGVFSHDDFQKKLDLGADLVQIYTGLIYRGPRIVKEILGQ